MKAAVHIDPQINQRLTHRTSIGAHGVIGQQGSGRGDRTSHGKPVACQLGVRTGMTGQQEPGRGQQRAWQAVPRYRCLSAGFDGVDTLDQLLQIRWRFRHCSAVNPQARLSAILAQLHEQFQGLTHDPAGRRCCGIAIARA